MKEKVEKNQLAAFKERAAKYFNLDKHLGIKSTSPLSLYFEVELDCKEDGTFEEIYSFKYKLEREMGYKSNGEYYSTARDCLVAAREFWVGYHDRVCYEGLAGNNNGEKS